MNGAALKTTESSRRLFILRVLGTVFSFALLVYLIRAQGWGEFREVIGRVDWVHLAAAAGLILASRICTTLRWFVLLRYANARISFWQAFRLMFVGNFASNFLPSTVGGDFARLAGAVQLGIDSATGAASLLVDRLVGMVGMASLSPFGLFLITRRADVALPAHSFMAVSLLSGVGQRIDRMPLIGSTYRKARHFVHGLLDRSVGWFRRPTSLLLALLYNYAHMLFTFLTIWLLLDGMNESISLLWVGALWSMSYFVSLLPVSINGWGLQELSITTLYSQFGGVSMEAALALAVLTRMLFLIASLPGALFAPDLLRPWKTTIPSETSDSSTPNI